MWLKFKEQKKNMKREMNGFSTFRNGIFSIQKGNKKRQLFFLLKMNESNELLYRVTKWNCAKCSYLMVGISVSDCSDEWIFSAVNITSSCSWTCRYYIHAIGNKNNVKRREIDDDDILFTTHFLFRTFKVFLSSYFAYYTRQF